MMTGTAVAWSSETDPNSTEAFFADIVTRNAASDASLGAADRQSTRSLQARS